MYINVYNYVGITNGPYKINVYNYDFPLKIGTIMAINKMVHDTGILW